ncbi:hypothetical protein D3C87_1875100 [compost metagenome]
MLIKLPLQAAQEGGGDEYGGKHRGNGDDGAGHFVHGAPCGLGRLLAIFDMTFDIFDHDDRVVDHYPDRQHQAKQ